MSIKNVCLLGANGNVGPMVLDALVKDGFNVTVLKRASSKSSSSYPSGVKVAEVDDAFAVDDLVPIFRGQDAVVVTIKGTQVDIQKRLADASVKAGVKRFIPADFGSCDSSSPHAQDCVPLFANKTELRNYLTDLTKSNESFTWSSIVCGHFFDWDTAFLHLWPKEKRADIVKDGSLKTSYSTLARVGEATSKILQRPAETANRVLFIQSFCITQVEIVKAFEKASNAKYEVAWLDADTYEREQKAKRDEGNKEAIENLVWLLGAIEGNWEERDEFAMSLLGLKNENLDEAASKVVRDNE
jgi:NAD(P)-dependent dehydrogenase (short-subunit alcohol dehydrogenase family)